MQKILPSTSDRFNSWETFFVTSEVGPAAPLDEMVGKQALSCLDRDVIVWMNHQFIKAGRQCVYSGRALHFQNGSFLKVDVTTQANKRPLGVARLCNPFCLNCDKYELISTDPIFIL
jgi:hypothetical protein